MAFDYRPHEIAIWDPWFVVNGDTVHLFHQQGRIDPGSARNPADCDAIGHAISRDLVNWTECQSVLYPDPAFPLEDLWAWTGCACEHEGRFYMFYTMRSSEDDGATERMGVALSDDCYNWTRYSGNPIIEPDGRWYLNRENATVPGRIDCRDLSVIFDEASGYWYGFWATRIPHEEMSASSVIGAARSKDLLNWEQLPPAFAPGTYGTIEVPDVFPLNGRWYMTCLTSTSHGNRPPWSDPHVIMGTMYAVADRPEGPYHEISGDNVLVAGSPPCPHSARSVLFEGERYIISDQETATTSTLSPPMLVRALPDGRLRLAYSSRTSVWRREALIEQGSYPPVLHHPRPLGHWCPLTSGKWEMGEHGYHGISRSGWQVGDIGIGAGNIEIEANLTLNEGVAGGLVIRPESTPDHCQGDIVVGLDAAEQTAFVASLPGFTEMFRRKFPVQVEQTYHLRISLRMPRLELYVDDILAVQCAVASRDFPNPSIGFFVDRGNVTVNNLCAFLLGND